MRFENDVEMYGAQATKKSGSRSPTFENDVEMYGVQALLALCLADWLFENDVEMYGAQANEQIRKAKISQGVS